MANETTPDPSAQFAEWVTQWERTVDEFSNKVMGTDEFSKSMNQMQGVQMEFQRNFGEMMARNLANLNMPSRDDVNKISEDLRSLDRRMAHIERSLGQLLKQGKNPGAKKKSGPARTRKPPAAAG
jgi:hypothetical protein